MKTYHPMVWQFQVAKRLRWWMALPFRPLHLVTYLTEWLWKFLDWYEWKIMNRVTIWYANRNAPETWRAPGGYKLGFEHGIKESNDVSTRKQTEDTAQTRAAPEETE